MKTLYEIADRILDICQIEDPDQRECLRREISAAIATERHSINEKIQMSLGELRFVIEKALLPVGEPIVCKKDP